MALFRHGALRYGEHVVIVGAGGNIGGVAVQLAVAAGADVTAIARSRHHTRLRELGARTVIDLPDVHRSGLPQAADLVLEAAGDNDLALWTPLMRSRGRFVLIAGMRGTASLPIGSVYLNSLIVTGFTISQAGPDDLAEAARGLIHALDRGLHPPAAIVRPFKEIASAHADLEAGTISGKQVICIVDAVAHPSTSTDRGEETP